MKQNFFTSFSIRVSQVSARLASPEDIATFSEGVERVESQKHKEQSQSNFEHSAAASTRMENRAVALEAVRSHCRFHKSSLMTIQDCSDTILNT